MMLDVYRDARIVRELVERLAGGPIQCASHLGMVDRIPGLSEFADAQIDQLTERVRMIIYTFPADGVSTTVSNATPHMFTPIRVPGMALENNGTERTIRDKIVIDRRRVRFPNWKAARNFSILRTFAATCEKNDLSAYQATIRMARDPAWDIFTDGIPQPISGGGAAPTDERAAPAEPA